MHFTSFCVSYFCRFIYLKSSGVYHACAALCSMAEGLEDSANSRVTRYDVIFIIITIEFCQDVCLEKVGLCFGWLWIVVSPS